MVPQVPLIPTPTPFPLFSFSHLPTGSPAHFLPFVPRLTRTPKTPCFLFRPVTVFVPPPVLDLRANDANKIDQPMELHCCSLARLLANQLTTYKARQGAEHERISLYC